MKKSEVKKARELLFEPDIAHATPTSVHDLRMHVEHHLGKSIGKEFMDMKVLGQKPSEKAIVLLTELLSQRSDMISILSLATLQEHSNGNHGS